MGRIISNLFLLGMLVFGATSSASAACKLAVGGSWAGVLAFTAGGAAGGPTGYNNNAMVIQWPTQTTPGATGTYVSTVKSSFYFDKTTTPPTLINEPTNATVSGTVTIQTADSVNCAGTVTFTPTSVSEKGYTCTGATSDTCSVANSTTDPAALASVNYAFVTALTGTVMMLVNQDIGPVTQASYLRLEKQ